MIVGPQTPTRGRCTAAGAGHLKSAPSDADDLLVTQAPETSTNGVHFVSVREAALRLGCGRSTLYRYVHTGDLHLIHHGRRSVVAVVEIDRLAKRMGERAGVVFAEDLSAG